MNSSIQKYLNQFLSGKVNPPDPLAQFRSVGGGSINDTYQVLLNNGARFFLKINSGDKYPRLLEKEKSGLEFLASQKIVHTPQVIVCDAIDQHQILLLEWIESGLKTERFWGKFGEQLATLHHVTNSYFGFEEDNYMGALPQRNRHYNSWAEFFVHCRLQPQVELATIKQLLHEKHVTAFGHLYEELEIIFNDEQPSLLHGDLWSGNFMCNQESELVLIDPAVYFGHRSMDLAMTTLFGGFERSFYESYHYHFPFPENYREQWDICNLYPLLIHLNLFGPGYLVQIERILQLYM